MNGQEIIEMARQAGLLDEVNGWDVWFPDELEAFAKLVAAKEREAAEERVVDLFTDMETPYLPDIIKAIRARP
jgi:hypothetical protein